MYRHGKVNWMLDSAIRFAICIAGIVVALEVHEKVKKRAKGQQKREQIKG